MSRIEWRVGLLYQSAHYQARYRRGLALAWCFVLQSRAVLRVWEWPSGRIPRQPHRTLGLALEHYASTGYRIEAGEQNILPMCRTSHSPMGPRHWMSSHEIQTCHLERRKSCVASLEHPRAGLELGSSHSCHGMVLGRMMRRSPVQEAHMPTEWPHCLASIFEALSDFQILPELTPDGVLCVQSATNMNLWLVRLCDELILRPNLKKIFQFFAIYLDIYFISTRPASFTMGADCEDLATGRQYYSARFSMLRIVDGAGRTLAV